MQQDLRWRLIAAFVLVAAVSCVQSLAVVCGVMVAAAIFALLAGPGWRVLLHRMAHVEGFLVVLVLFVVFGTPGRVAMELGPLTATEEGIARAALLLLRVNAAAFLLAGLLGRADAHGIGAALSGLRLPPAFVRIAVLSIRYLSVTGEEFRRLQETARARGFTARSNLHTWRSWGNMTGMMLLRALDRADRVEEAMRARGGSTALIRRPEAGIAPAEMLALALSILLAVGIVLLDRLG